jgi:hypothetical protein
MTTPKYYPSELDNTELKIEAVELDPEIGWREWEELHSTSFQDTVPADIAPITESAPCRQTGSRGRRKTDSDK